MVSASPLGENHDSRAIDVLIPTILTTVVAFILTGLRLYVRRFMVRMFGWDDVFNVLALVSISFQTPSQSASNRNPALAVRNCGNGPGHHINQVWARTSFPVPGSGSSGLLREAFAHLRVVFDILNDIPEDFHQSILETNFVGLFFSASCCSPSTNRGDHLVSRARSGKSSFGASSHSIRLPVPLTLPLSSHNAHLWSIIGTRALRGLAGPIL